MRKQEALGSSHRKLVKCICLWRHRCEARTVVPFPCLLKHSESGGLPDRGDLSRALRLMKAFWVVSLVAGVHLGFQTSSLWWPFLQPRADPLQLCTFLSVLESLMLQSNELMRQ